MTTINSAAGILGSVGEMIPYGKPLCFRWAVPTVVASITPACRIMPA
ncbi:MAG: hypothetical protein JSS02_27570 [Planctomycetes bacterium]|nr:hypothetical protein [Planctomycetota bacterium]